VTNAPAYTLERTEMTMSNQLELPEIETLRRDLEREIAGRKIKSTDVKSLKSLPRHRTKKAFAENLEGAKINIVERHGLFIVIQLNNEHSLVIELGPNGRLQKCASKTKPDADIVITITFTQGGDLRIADKDGSTKVSVVSEEEFSEVVPPEEERGLDLLVRPISWIEFGRLVLKRREPLKVLLTDPKVFVGIGPVYSDEILFDAVLKYDRPADSLSMQELRRLYRSVVGILHDAIKYRGVSLESRPFFDLAGNPGEYTDHLAVYGKAGELSPRSRLPLRKAQFKGQTVYFCETQV
jgi:formamidopyrimidine-DNA glycosylase